MLESGSRSKRKFPQNTSRSHLYSFRNKRHLISKIKSNRIFFSVTVKKNSTIIHAWSIPSSSGIIKNSLKDKCKETSFTSFKKGWIGIHTSPLAGSKVLTSQSTSCQRMFGIIRNLPDYKLFKCVPLVKGYNVSLFTKKRTRC